MFERQPNDITDLQCYEMIDEAKDHRFNRCIGALLDDNSIVALSCNDISLEKAANQIISVYQLENVKAFFYSIVNNATYPTIDEMLLQNKLDKPMFAISLDQDMELISAFWWETNNMPALINRAFRFGTMDCYALVRDAYKQLFKIELPNYARHSLTFENKGYSDHLINDGFVIINDGSIQFGDIICGSIGGKGITNHGGIVIDNNRILHHLLNKKSEIDDLNKWRKRLKKVLRHKSFLNNAPELLTIES